MPPALPRQVAPLPIATASKRFNVLWVLTAKPRVDRAKGRFRRNARHTQLDATRYARLLQPRAPDRFGTHPTTRESVFAHLARVRRSSLFAVLPAPRQPIYARLNGRIQRSRSSRTGTCLGGRLSSVP